MTTHQSPYPCLVSGCYSTACYIAKDNRARYGHICKLCWNILPPEAKNLYAPYAPQLNGHRYKKP